jgi:hypothetical protein
MSTNNYEIFLDLCSTPFFFTNNKRNFRMSHRSVVQVEAPYLWPPQTPKVKQAVFFSLETNEKVVRALSVAVLQNEKRKRKEVG